MSVFYRLFQSTTTIVRKKTLVFQAYSVKLSWILTPRTPSTPPRTPTPHHGPPRTTPGPQTPPEPPDQKSLQTEGSAEQAVAYKIIIFIQFLVTGKSRSWRDTSSLEYGEEESETGQVFTWILERISRHGACLHLGIWKE